MKPKHIFWGLLFICLGILILLNNFGRLPNELTTLWKFWPAVFILLGIALLVGSNFIKGILSAFAAIILSVAIFSIFFNVTSTIDDHFVFDFDDEDNGRIIIDGNQKTKIFEKYNSDIQKVNFHFDAAAGSFALKDTTKDYLYFIEASGHNLKSSFDISGKQADVDISSKMKIFSFHDRKLANKAIIRLNKNPMWYLNFDIGAASAKLDLTPFKVNTLNIDMGAASLEIKLGNISELTNVNIEAGASSINILIPESSGCQVETNTELSAKHFEGFENIDSGLYRTNNFETSEKKLLLKIDSGVSSISIKKYSPENH